MPFVSEAPIVAAVFRSGIDIVFESVRVKHKAPKIMNLEVCEREPGFTFVVRYTKEDGIRSLLVRCHERSAACDIWLKHRHHLP